MAEKPKISDCPMYRLLRMGEIVATLIHDHPLMPKMTLPMTVDRESYLAEVARARTFCFEHEVQYLKSQGLAQGGTLENAIVVGKDKFHTNAEGLRHGWLCRRWQHGTRLSRSHQFRRRCRCGLEYGHLLVA